MTLQTPFPTPAAAESARRYLLEGGIGEDRLDLMEQAGKPTLAIQVRSEEEAATVRRLLKDMGATPQPASEPKDNPAPNEPLTYAPTNPIFDQDAKGDDLTPKALRRP